MHDSPAGKIKGPELGCPSSAPDPVGKWIIHNRRPEKPEYQKRTEFNAFSKSGRNNCNGYRSKNELEYHVQQPGNRRAVRTGFHPDVVQAHILKVTDEPSNISTKCERVPDHYPLDTHQCESNERQGKH